MHLIHQIVSEKIETLTKAIQNTKHERDNSASPMESQHDMTRQTTDQLLVSLENQKKELQSLLKTPIPSNTSASVSIGSEIIVENLEDKTKQHFLITPTLLGGTKYGETTCISFSSPLGKIIEEKKQGDLYEINNRQFKIISLK